MTTSAKKVLKQRITLLVQPGLVKQARAQAVFEEITLTQLIEHALIKYLPTETIVRKPDV